LKRRKKQIKGMRLLLQAVRAENEAESKLLWRTPCKQRICSRHRSNFHKRK
jgi:hypothetical protein